MLNVDLSNNDGSVQWVISDGSGNQMGQGTAVGPLFSIDTSGFISSDGDYYLQVISQNYTYPTVKLLRME